MKHIIHVGTRGSQLAITQTTEVIEQLKVIAPKMKYEVIPIRTGGDNVREGGAFEGKQIFTQEIDKALIQGEVDIAVHSMKDLTTEPSTQIEIVAVPKRGNPHDVLVSRRKEKFSELPPNAKVGTSSPRRKSQVLAARGDLQVIDIRGNVETRLSKLRNGDYDAIILAAAGLERLKLSRNITEILRTNLMLPAVGQGALAVQSRIDDQDVKELVHKMDHPITRREVEAERAFAKKLGADCTTPIAAYAKSDSSKLTIEGLVASHDGRMLVRGRITSDNTDSNGVGEELAQSLIDKGALAVLEAPS